MCGIFGFVSKKELQADEILNGLKTLEYRGYDSWGIAVRVKNPAKGEARQRRQKSKIKNKISVIKNTGKIGNAKINFSKTNIGIGHTRWATHGGVNVKNAHPHLDCKQKIALMHNGIVENYLEIKKDLEKKGHKFNSQTDTEVIVHLIEENLETKGFASSVRDAFKKLSGMNAIVVMNSLSLEIIAVKSGSPLIVGKTKDTFYIASDLLAIDKTNDLLFLKDNQMVILGKDLQLIDLLTQKKLKPVFETINWKRINATKGKFKHFMIKEVFDQPYVIRNILKNSEDNIKEITALIDKAFGTFFIGAGTAYFACLAGSYLFSKIAKKHINTLPASEFNYLEDFLTKESLVVALSQSGETIDVVEPLQRAKLKQSKIVAITNVQGSTIYRMADKKFLLLAGPEKAVASTKAYIAKLCFLLLTSFALNKDIKKGQEVLEKTADEIDKILSGKNLLKIKNLSNKLKNSQDIYVLGRGFSYTSALEAALKIREVSYIHAEGLAGGELKHGSIALVTKNTPCLVFAPNDETYAAIISNAQEIKARGGYIIGISFKENPVFDLFFKVSDIKEGSYLAQIVPIQVLAYYLSVVKKLDPDKPRNLAKSVTVK